MVEVELFWEPLCEKPGAIAFLIAFSDLSLLWLLNNDLFTLSSNVSVSDGDAL